jgi:hypothetical protein
MTMIDLPRHQLMALQCLDLGILVKEETTFREEWKKNKNCDCVHKLADDQLPWCRHVREAFNSRFRKEIDKIFSRDVMMAYRSFSSNECFD